MRSRSWQSLPSVRSPGRHQPSAPKGSTPTRSASRPRPPRAARPPLTAPRRRAAPAPRAAGAPAADPSGRPRVQHVRGALLVVGAVGALHLDEAMALVEALRTGLDWKVHSCSPAGRSRLATSSSAAPIPRPVSPGSTYSCSIHSPSSASRPASPASHSSQPRDARRGTRARRRRRGARRDRAGGGRRSPRAHVELGGGAGVGGPPAADRHGHRANTRPLRCPSERSTAG